MLSKTPLMPTMWLTAARKHLPRIRQFIDGLTDDELNDAADMMETVSEMIRARRGQ